MRFNNSFDTYDFGAAMKNAVIQNSESKFVSVRDNRILFNGFWRNGDKQNVCLWLDRATWHDAKTGEGGGCKEFAQVAFNMSLPDFMERFGSERFKPFEDPKTKKIQLSKSVNQIFTGLKHNHLSAKWLEEKRGFINPLSKIGSGFFDLNINDVYLFEERHHNFIKHRISIAQQMIVPLRSVYSDEVKNLFFRSIENCPKEEKSRLLPDAGGWQEEDGSPRAFGFPYLIKEFPNLILCEGMADYFACEILLDCEHNYLPIGVGSASALIKWADWLVENKYAGKVHIIFHLDNDRHGHLSDKGTGQDNAVKCAQILNKAFIKTQIFSWLTYLDAIKDYSIRDLGDSLKSACSLENLQNNFINVISGAIK